ncbi:unnamed protein product [Lathyrus oleraceus]|uniref:delta(3,5)-Delta(2,4)-dienoyl-CoA isomerase, peroxisomal n=1 Tax=Pisum sativum TaxID=3888 RepID=UPI001FC51AC4|nr:delta(3,5)-Delta(2,4)-dienoyl-CoA isomerase, peroxisomal-like [Pisum sativum]
MQDSIIALEQCRKRVIASMHGGYICGGIVIIIACDIRVCTKYAFSSVKEMDLALAVDLGSLQRLSSIVGFGNTMDLALTARTFFDLEEKYMDLVSRVFYLQHELDKGVRNLLRVGFFFLISIFIHYC